MLSRILGLVAILPGLLAAQAATEAVLGSAKSAVTGAAASQGASQVLGTGLNKVGQLFGDTVGRAPATPAATPAKTPARRAVTGPTGKRVATRRPLASGETPTPVAVPETSHENPAGIQAGMEYGEVIRRFGAPGMKFTSGAGEEMLSYTKDDQMVDVRMSNGKVVSVHRIGDVDPAPAAKLP